MSNFWGGSNSNRDYEDRRESVGYTRLLNDMDDMYSTHMSSDDRNRVNTIKEQRMKSWRSLQSQYPACDEEILYSTLKTLDFDLHRTTAALTDMGIKPGMEGLEDEPPRQQQQQRYEQPARQEYGGLQAPAQHYDASNPFAIPPPGSGHASPYLQRSPQPIRNAQSPQPIRNTQPASNVPTADLISFD